MGNGKKPIINGKNKKNKKKKRGSETNMQIVQSPVFKFPLQRLYMSCLDVFKGVGTVPSPSDEQTLRDIIDEKVLNKEEGKDYRWLKEIEIPKESLKMDVVEYLGPEVVEFTL